MKKIKSKFCRPICWLACVSLALSSGVAADIFSSIEIPVFHNGYHLKKEVDYTSGTKSISYRVQKAFPAADVLEFYDSYFNASGWRSSFEICQRHWDRLIDETKPGGVFGKQLFASWEHPKLNLTAVLRLEYEMVNEKWRDELAVRCRLQSKAN